MFIIKHSPTISIFCSYLKYEIYFEIADPLIKVFIAQDDKIQLQLSKFNLFKTAYLIWLSQLLAISRCSFRIVTITQRFSRRREIFRIDRSPYRRDRREFFGEFTMGRKLANLWPCKRVKSLCGSTEIARARFSFTLNGPRTTIGRHDELFGRHELSHSASILLRFRHAASNANGK